MSKKPKQLRLPLSKSKTFHFRAGSMRTKESILEAIKKAVKKCPLDREDIAKEVSRLVGDEFSIHSLNNMLSEGKQDRRLPLEFAKALTMITGDLDILRAALEPEFSLIDQNGKAAYDYGIMIIEDKERSKKKKRLEQKARGLF